MRRFRKKTGLPFQGGSRLPRPAKTSHPVTTSTGRQVRSSQEKVCAEFLSQHRIRFIYEPLLLLSGRQYRPDFYLPDLDIFIEICGFIHMPFYRDRMEEKKRVYASQGLRVEFIEVGPGRPLRKQLELLFGHTPSGQP
jgi:predicted nuclease of restriction endonuclease-like RecB superfamily